MHRLFPSYEPLCTEELVVFKHLVHTCCFFFSLSTHTRTHTSAPRPLVWLRSGFPRLRRGACRAGGGQLSSVLWRTDVSVCAALGKMAEAAAVPPHRFFCHCCKGEVNPKLPVRRTPSSPHPSRSLLQFVRLTSRPRSGKPFVSLGCYS